MVRVIEILFILILVTGCFGGDAQESDPVETRPPPASTNPGGGDRGRFIMSMHLPSSNSGYKADPYFHISDPYSSSGSMMYFYADDSCKTMIGSVNTTNGSAVLFTVQISIPGTYTFSVKAQDGMTGGMSGCATSTVSYTLLEPLVPTSLSLSQPSASPAYDPTPRIKVNGAAKGHTVKLYTDSSCTAEVGSGTAVGAGSIGEATIDVNSLATGSYAIYAKAFNEAGYASACSSASVNYTVLAPPVPTSLSLNNPGASPSYDSTPSILVSGSVQGVTVRLYSDSTCSTEVGSQQASSATTYVTTSVLAAGSYTFYALTDNGQTKSSCSTAHVDYQVLVPPVPSGLSLNYPASSPGDETRPSITVAGVSAGLTVRLYTDSSCQTEVGYSYASSSNVNVTTSTLSLGSYTFYALTDNGSTRSACSTANVAYQLVQLQMPTSLSLVTPSSSPSYLSVPTIKVSGVGNSETVKLYADSSCTDEIGSKSVPSAQSFVDITIDRYLSAGTHNFYAKRSRIGGNTSDCSTATVSYTKVNRSELDEADSYSIGRAAKTGTTGDFNNDGVLDLAIPANQSYAVNILLGVGDGTFSAGVDITNLGWIHGIDAADFNGDGNLDLAVGGEGSSDAKVIILPGNGDGTFGSAVNHFIGNSTRDPYFVLARDFNNDGDIDIAFISRAVLSIFMGNGDLTFQAPVNYPVLSRSETMATEDLNGDGFLDIAASSFIDDKVSIFINNGDGTFQTRVDYSAGSSAYDIALGDIDENGSIDILVTMVNSDEFLTLLNNGDGTFAPATTFPFKGPSWSNKSAALGDVDMDGHLDVVLGVDDGFSAHVIVFHGLGNGLFVPAESFPATGTALEYLIVKDLDGDGDNDILSLGGHSVGVLDVFINLKTP